MSKIIDFRNDQLTDLLGQEVAKNTIVHLNIETEYIMISEDKLLYIVLEYQVKSRVDWATPLSLFIAFLFALIFNEPKRLPWFTRSEIHACTIIATGLIFIWLMHSFYRLYINRHFNRDYLINEIKKHKIEK